MPGTVNFYEIGRTKSFENNARTTRVTYQAKVTGMDPGEIASELATSQAQDLTVPTGYYFKSADASHINRNPEWLTVTVTYTDERTSTGGTHTDDPLDRPSILSMSYDEWTEPYFEDSNDDEVVNTAGDVFENPPQRKRGTMVLQITKNFATLAASAYDTIKFTTNASQVTIKGTVFAVRTLLFLPISAQEIYEGEHNYYQVTFRIAVDEDEHVQVVANRGYREKVGSEIKDIIIDGKPTADPWPLNSDGTKATAPPATAITFVPYPSATWGVNFN